MSYGFNGSQCEKLDCLQSVWPCFLVLHSWIRWFSPWTNDGLRYVLLQMIEKCQSSLSVQKTWRSSLEFVTFCNSRSRITSLTEAYLVQLQWITVIHPFYDADSSSRIFRKLRKGWMDKDLRMKRNLKWRNLRAKYNNTKSLMRNDT